MANLSRRGFFKVAGAGAISAAPGLLPGTKRRPLTMKSSDFALYIGTYTNGDSEGIYVGRLNTESGEVAIDQAVGDIDNPSFLAVDGGQQYLYAVSETTEYEGSTGGSVVAYAIDRASGGLRLLNRQPSHGGAPCHITVDRGNRYVLVANYVGGNAAIFPIEAGGRLGQASDVVQHHGTGPNTQRQEAAHAHSVTVDPSNRFAYVADLGIDKVMTYRLDTEAGKLVTGIQPAAIVKAGAGPRHFAFHPGGRWAYVINELDSSITAFAFDAATGGLFGMQTVPTLPAGFNGNSTCADLHVHPSGRFVYGSNRGHDSIAVYAVDPEKGTLSLLQHEPTQGRTPRNFAIDPTGRYLLAANQNSDTIVSFHIDPEHGTLTPTGHTTSVPAPVCLRFALPHA